MNHLHRELAPIDERAWGEIEEEAEGDSGGGGAGDGSLGIGSLRGEA